MPRSLPALHDRPDHQGVTAADRPGCAPITTPDESTLMTDEKTVTHFGLPHPAVGARMES